MAVVETVEANFAAGELAPAIRNRVDSDLYHAGLAKARNVVARLQGGMRTRPGTRRVQCWTAGLGGHRNMRLYPFVFSDDQEYLVVALAGAIRIYRDDARVYQASAPWNSQQLFTLQATQDLDTMFFFHPDLQPRALVRGDSHTSWTLSTWTLTGIPRDGVPPKEARISIDRDPEATDDPATPDEDEAVAARTWTWDRELGTNTAGWTVLIERATGEEITVPSSQYSLSPTTDGGTIVFGAAANLDLGDVVVIRQRDTRPVMLSDEAGWPSCGVVHQGRLIVAGSPRYPNSIWMSRVGDLHDFDVSEPDKPDSGIHIAHESGQVNRIHSISVGRNLSLFGDSAELYIPNAATQPMTPTNVVLRQASRRGAARGVPVVDVDGALAFVQSGRAAVRIAVFSESEQSYVNRSLSISAAHLMDSPVDMAYQQASASSDTSLLFVVNSGGSMAVLAIDRAEDIVAWTRWDTDGKILSVAVLGDEVYLAVDRGDAAGSSRYCLERLDYDMEVDYGVSGLTGGNTNRASWLTGRDVAVVTPDDRRVELREYTGTVDFTSVQVGLPWPDAGAGGGWLIQTMPFVSRGTSSPLGSFSRKRRVLEAEVDYASAHGMFVNGNRVGIDGVRSVHGISGWDERAQVTVTGDRPADIRGLVYKVAV